MEVEELKDQDKMDLLHTEEQILTIIFQAQLGIQSHILVVTKRLALEMD